MKDVCQRVHGTRTTVLAMSEYESNRLREQDLIIAEDEWWMRRAGAIRAVADLKA
jgi:hypothetical protein